MAEQIEHIRVGITIGDINGIGPEVIIKTLKDERSFEHLTPIIYGSSRTISYHCKQLKISNFDFEKLRTEDKPKQGKINIVNCWSDDIKVNFGDASNEAGKAAFASLQAATDALAAGEIDVLVTAPINKKTIQNEDFDFPGHTEYLAKMAHVDQPLMIMVSNKLRVGVVTGHIPLKEVPSAISKSKIVECAKILNSTLIKDFTVTRPKIAILGLNPHAGEDGLLGDEEKKIIVPAIQAAQNEGILAYGPFPGDGFFGSGNFKNFDGVLAMYHDQGLVAFKSLSFGTGVNYTAGLPIVRTSPDHGTGYEIAGKGEADESSFRSALFLAKDIFNSRKFHKIISGNPLKVKKQKKEYSRA